MPQISKAIWEGESSRRIKRGAPVCEQYERNNGRSLELLPTRTNAALDQGFARISAKGATSSVKATGFRVKGTGFSPYIDKPKVLRALAPEGMRIAIPSTPAKESAGVNLRPRYSTADFFPQSNLLPRIPFTIR